MSKEHPWFYVKEPDRRLSKCIPCYKNFQARYSRRMEKQYLHVWELEYCIGPEDHEELGNSD